MNSDNDQMLDSACLTSEKNKASVAGTTSSAFSANNGERAYVSEAALTPPEAHANTASVVPTVASSGDQGYFDMPIADQGGAATPSSIAASEAPSESTLYSDKGQDDVVKALTTRLTTGTRR
ncbi:hypothetical protein BGZ54_005022 [Gamsiella multidivaricata]|nr:hypothetical protein BGZ54_005022 [Gamsiella multidivaricata]